MTAAHRLTAPPALAPEQCRNLLDYLAEIADPRHRRGRRHSLATVLAVAGVSVQGEARVDRASFQGDARFGQVSGAIRG